ncbi:DUF2480 family protein [Psychroflexus sp. ALD_RP9]|uniref:DUF2480 family protein n=1 Tax=Psychroflexus sp. ALD_RP9 TaxID=2777186 RepID=UPI001A8CFDD6|nr:DUF2480 family protein [Psychroflexus sp. ALD_RP9]QSS97970.1 DUF2480 family protein [Psychroflexus sp. ALD_RP9]
MAEEIINRVANSKLVTINLEDFYQDGPRFEIDLKNWLVEGFILREKEFRAELKSHNWSVYKDAYVSLHCSTDAIVPAWAYMLISSHLSQFAKKIIYGNLETLESILYAEVLQSFDASEFKNKPIIIKGCSNKPVPQNAYLLLQQKLQPEVKSIMFGEACSAVPLYKQSRNKV